MILSPHPEWHITAVDQSIAAGMARRHDDRQPARGYYPVTIRAQAAGVRYDRWNAAVQAGDEDEVERIAISAVGVGRTYEDAFEDLSDRIQTIEDEQPIA